MSPEHRAVSGTGSHQGSRTDGVTSVVTASGSGADLGLGAEDIGKLSCMPVGQSPYTNIHGIVCISGVDVGIGVVYRWICVMCKWYRHVFVSYLYPRHYNNTTSTTPVSYYFPYTPGNLSSSKVDSTYPHWEPRMIVAILNEWIRDKSSRSWFGWLW